MGMKPVPVTTEEDQIRLLQAGDESILQIIYRQYYQTIIQLVMNNNGSLQEAKDIYQETLIIFYEKVMGENFELNCKLKTYLYSISRNLWLKQLQHKKRFTNTISDSEEYLEIPWEEAGKKEDQYKAMHVALESLGEPCRSILKDFYIHSQSMEEITEKFGYTNADNAKNQKYKCLKRLKKVFFDSYGNVGGLNYDE